jgi:DNA-binding Xre family transcriptional regulator
MSQKRAAAICEVDERTYQRWESGETKKVRGVYLERMCGAAAKRKKKRGA